MIITSPDPFTPFDRALFRIEQADPSAVVAVDFISGGQVLSRKRFSGASSYTVSAAYLLPRLADPQPLPAGPTAILEPVGRTALLALQAGGITTRSVCFLPGTHAAAAGDLLEVPSAGRTLAAGEYDELTVACRQGLLVASIGCGAVPDWSMTLPAVLVDTPRLYTVRVDAADVDARLRVDCALTLEEAGSITASISCTGVISRRTWQVVRRPAGTLRLVWLNGRGGMEWATVCAAGRTLRPRRSRILSSAGWHTTSGNLSREIVLRWPCATQAGRDYLSSMLASPRVWLAREGGFVLLDVPDQAISADGCYADVTVCMPPQTISGLD